MKTDKKFDKAYKSWIIGCQKKVDERMSQYPPQDYILITEPGRKFIKVIEDNRGRQSVWGFVDMTNGDVLKAASWKTPAKHARGNIFDDNNGLAHVSGYGPNYLR